MKKSHISPRASIILGSLTLVIFAILSVIYFTKPHYQLDDNLIEVTGLVTSADKEGVGKHDDLLIQLSTSDIRYRSPMSYPSEFTYGSETIDYLQPGTVVTITVEESEQRSLPRKHRIKGYSWREFVGLSAGGYPHLAPNDHELYERNNNRLGKFLLPLFSLLGAYLLYDGLKKLPLQNKTLHPTAYRG